ncbi:hypothetical protein FRX31_011446, partial [Thalictrum thalictroides]
VIENLKRHLDCTFALAGHPNGRILATGNQYTRRRVIEFTLDSRAERLVHTYNKISFLLGCSAWGQFWTPTFSNADSYIAFNGGRKTRISSMRSFIMVVFLDLKSSCTSQPALLAICIMFLDPYIFKVSLFMFTHIHK